MLCIFVGLQTGAASWKGKTTEEKRKRNYETRKPGQHITRWLLYCAHSAAEHGFLA